MSQIIVIKVFHKNQLISVKQFEQDQIVIGKQSDAGMVLHHKDVAQMHCVVEKRGDKYFLCDLGSEIGTEVHGHKILEHQLRDGESFTISDLRLQFFEGVPGAKKHAASTGKAQVQPEASAKQSSEETPQPSGVKKEEVSAKAEPQDEVQKSNKNISSQTEEKPESVNEEVSPQTQTSEPVSGAGSSKEEKKDEEEIEVAPTSVQKSDEVLSPQQIENVSNNQKSSGASTASSIGGAAGTMGYVSKATLAEDVDKSLGTFAPNSDYVDLDEIIDVNSRGSIVEVTLTWKERILSTSHFGQKQKVFLGNRPDCDVQLSVLDFKHEFIDINNGAQVFLPGRMDGFLYRGTQRIPFSSLRDNGQLERRGNCFVLNLAQGEMARCFLMGDKIQAYVSYVEQTPKATGVPLFDFTRSELVAISVSFILSALIAIYMTFTGPEKLDELDTLLADQYRVAVVEFNPPPDLTLPDKQDIEIPEDLQKDQEKVVTQVSEKASEKPVKKAKKTNKKRQTKKSLGKKGDKNLPDKVVDKTKGAPKEVAPNKNKIKKKGLVSNKPGGAVGTGKSGANAKTKKKDVSKTGLLGVLSSGGAAKSLDQAYSGAGTTFGMADKATGYGGQASDRPGDGLGTDLKNIGAGGKGESSVGISGVGSKGRGGGQLRYGGNGGLGNKGRVAVVNIEGNSGEFVSTIDKEAIRRLIRRNESAIKSCYDRELAKSPNLAGRIVLQWSIVDGGKMVKPGVKSSDIPGRSLSNCIISRLRVLKFPDPGPNEIAQVAFPFVFEAR